MPLRLLRSMRRVTQRISKRNSYKEPLPGETPEEYAERIGGLEGSNMWGGAILQSKFGLSEEDAKRIYFGSNSFWDSFFRERCEEMRARGISRSRAMRFIRERCDWTEKQTEEFVDALGNWKH